MWAYYIQLFILILCGGSWNIFYTVGERCFSLLLICGNGWDTSHGHIWRHVLYVHTALVYFIGRGRVRLVHGNVSVCDVHQLQDSFREEVNDLCLRIANRC